MAQNKNILLKAMIEKPHFYLWLHLLSLQFLFLIKTRHLLH